MGAWLGLLRQVPAQADPLVVGVLVNQLTDLDRLHDGLPSQPAFRAFARSLLNPFRARRLAGRGGRVRQSPRCAAT
jgi:hypothetical protein